MDHCVMCHVGGGGLGLSGVFSQWLPAAWRHAHTRHAVPTARPSVTAGLGGPPGSVQPECPLLLSSVSTSVPEERVVPGSVPAHSRGCKQSVL